MIGWNHLQQFKAHARNLDCENVSQVHTLFFYQRENCLKAFFVRTVQFFVVNKKVLSPQIIELRISCYRSSRCCYKKTVLTFSFEWDENKRLRTAIHFFFAHEPPESGGSLIFRPLFSFLSQYVLFIV